MGKNKKIHYGWFILAACFVLNMTVHTITMQMASFYTVPMYQDLQCPRTLLAMQSVAIAVAAVITAPIWGKIYKTHNSSVILALCTGMTGLAMVLRSFMPNIWGILALAIVKGIFFTGSTALPISILLTVWFKKKRGLVISIASLGISLGSVVFSPIVERLISTFGWRTSDKILGFIMIAVMVPISLIVVRSKPQDKQLKPYGADDADAPVQTEKGAVQVAQSGMTLAEARKKPALYLFLIAVFGMTFATGAALQLAAYLTDIGYDTSVAAKVVAGYSAVAIVGKLILGAFIDKFGEKAGSIYISVVGILSFVCFILAGNKGALYALVVLWGLASGITSVLPPMLTSKIFGNKDYGPIYGVVVSVNRFGGVIGNVLVSFLFDLTKDYSIIWPLCLVSMVITLVFVLYCLNTAKKAEEA